MQVTRINNQMNTINNRKKTSPNFEGRLVLINNGRCIDSGLIQEVTRTTDYKGVVGALISFVKHTLNNYQPKIEPAATKINPQPGDLPFNVVYGDGVVKEVEKVFIPGDFETIANKVSMAKSSTGGVVSLTPEPTIIVVSH